MDTDVSSEMSKLRSGCEVYFYMCLEHMDRDEAEKMSVEMMRAQLKGEIAVNERYRDASQSHIDDLVSEDDDGIDFEMGFNRGLLISNRSRLTSHEKELQRLRNDLELLKFV